MANDYLPTIYTPAFWSGTNSATYGITTASNTTWNPSLSIPVGGWPEVTMHKAKQDPFDWLRAETERYVDLGRLDD